MFNTDLNGKLYSRNNGIFTLNRDGKFALTTSELDAVTN